MSFKVTGILFMALILSLTGGVITCIAQSEAPSAEQADLGVNDKTASVDFTYSPMGRRDPFKPLVAIKVKIAGKKSGRSADVKGPLEKFELSQYRLIALMVVKGVPRAMVKGPDGKSYTVKVGEYIGMNDGIVKNIQTKVVGFDDNGMRIDKSPDRIIVEEVGINSLTGKEVKENRYIVM